MHAASTRDVVLSPGLLGEASGALGKDDLAAAAKKEVSPERKNGGTPLDARFVKEEEDRDAGGAAHDHLKPVHPLPGDLGGLMIERGRKNRRGRGDWGAGGGDEVSVRSGRRGRDGGERTTAAEILGPQALPA